MHTASSCVRPVLADELVVHLGKKVCTAFLLCLALACHVMKTQEYYEWGMILAWPAICKQLRICANAAVYSITFRNNVWAHTADPSKKYRACFCHCQAHSKEAEAHYPLDQVKAAPLVFVGGALRQGQRCNMNCRHKTH